jgi:uncharacterized protein YtpQ (UPF0354 family)
MELIIPAIVAVAIIVWAVVAHMRKARVMSQEEFQAAFKEKIEKEHPDVRIESESDFGFDLQVKGKPHRMNLANAYAIYARDPNAFEEIVRRHLSIVDSSRADVADMSWEEVKGRVLPVIKPEDYVEAAREEMAKAGSDADPVVLDYREGLKIMVVIDFPESMATCNVGQLANWGLSKEQLLETALRNLAVTTAPHWPTVVPDEAQNALIFEVNDGYDASRILLPDFYERASRYLNCPRIAVGIPCRDLLIALPANAVEFIRKTGALVEKEYRENPYSIWPEFIHLPD